MKKLGILLLSAVLAVCVLAVFSACDEPGHTHSFGDWKLSPSLLAPKRACVSGSVPAARKSRRRSKLSGMTM